MDERIGNFIMTPFHDYNLEKQNLDPHPYLPINCKLNHYISLMKWDESKHDILNMYNHCTF